MKCLVTGGAGFIGSHLVDRLMAAGHSVTVYDNMSSGRREFIAHHLGKKQFRFISGDLLDLAKVKKAMKGREMVFHLAANPDARLGNTNTSLDLQQETVVTYNVLEAMRVCRVGKMAFSSSGTIYGETPVVPLSEDYGPVLPISLYGAGKVASEGLISAFCGTFGMQAWIYRFANIIGPRATHGVIYDFVKKLKKDPGRLEILGDGTQEKPYLHVEECLDGILHVLDRANDRLNVYNLGVESSTNVTNIARLVISEMGLKGVSLRYTGGSRGWPGDVPQVRFDCAKVNRLGWKARLSSDGAVRRAITEIVRELEG